MQKLSISCGLLLTVLACPAAFAAYQTEAGAGWSRFNSNAASGLRDTGAGGDLTWHFNSVDTDDVPLAEAAFLARSSNLHAAFSKHGSQDYSLANLGLDVTAGWFQLADDLTQTHPDVGSNGYDYDLKAGVRSDHLLAFLGALDGNSYTNTRVQAGFKYVNTLNVQYFNLEGRVSRAVHGKARDNYTETRLRGDWYPTDALGLGLHYAHADKHLDTSTTLGTGIDYFITPYLRTGIDYDQTRHAQSGARDTLFDLRLALRF